MTHSSEVIQLIQSSKIADRKKGIKIIAGSNLVDLGDYVFQLLNKELKTRKSWEFIIEVMDCLATLKYKDALPTLRAICLINEAHDMITSAASKALCIISRSSSQDVNTEIELLSFGKFSVVSGALKALNKEHVIPDDSAKIRIINLVENFNPKLEKGYTDVRMSLASACAGWLSLAEVNVFLANCLASDYQPLVKVTKAALKGKYSLL